MRHAKTTMHSTVLEAQIDLGTKKEKDKLLEKKINTQTEGHVVKYLYPLQLSTNENNDMTLINNSSTGNNHIM
jgi:hypothetical protein